MSDVPLTGSFAETNRLPPPHIHLTAVRVGLRNVVRLWQKAESALTEGLRSLVSKRIGPRHESNHASVRRFTSSLPRYQRINHIEGEHLRCMMCKQGGCILSLRRDADLIQQGTDFHPLQSRGCLRSKEDFHLRDLFPSAAALIY